MTNVDGLTNLVNTLTTAAGSNVYPPGNLSNINLGSTASPQINVVNGDFTLGGGSSGAGILVVTGTLTMNGNPSFIGLILVIGKGDVQKNGGGNGTLDGSLFVANLYTDATHTTPIALGSNNPPGPANNFLERRRQCRNSIRQLLIEVDEPLDCPRVQDGRSTRANALNP